VEKHRARIMQTLKINSLAELVKFAIREGLTKL
jgi:FixJ family two-component response regulator